MNDPYVLAIAFGFVPVDDARTTPRPDHGVRTNRPRRSTSKLAAILTRNRSERRRSTPAPAAISTRRTASHT